MKTIITILMLTPLFIKAQSINDIPLDSLDIPYIGIDIQFTLSKAKIKVDVGQVDWLFNYNKIYLKDKDGKMMVFNSSVDALNFFHEVGYDLTGSYTIGASSVYFILKRRE